MIEETNERTKERRNERTGGYMSVFAVLKMLIQSETGNGKCIQSCNDNNPKHLYVKFKNSDYRVVTVSLLSNCDWILKRVKQQYFHQKKSSPRVLTSD